MQKSNDPFIMVPQKVQDALCKTRIAGVPRQMLDVIIRKTYGFRLKEARIALRYFEKITGVKNQHVARAIQQLLAMRIIEKHDGEEGNLYSINEQTEKWNPLPKKGASKDEKSTNQSWGSVASKMGAKKDTEKESITDTCRAEILKWFSSPEFGIENPEAYLRKIEKTYPARVITKAWKSAKTTTGCESPPKFFEWCRYFLKVMQKTYQEQSSDAEVRDAL